MHILTKVFVLFASILSVLMAALAISYTVNTDRIVQDYDHAQQAKIAADNALKAERTINSQETITLNATIDQLRGELANMESSLRERESIIADLTIKERQAKASRDSIEGKLTQLTVTVQTQTELIDSYKSELAGLRGEQLRWRDDKIDIESKLSDLTNQVTVYEANERALQEQLAEAKDEIQKVRGGGPLASSSAARTTPTEIPGPLIRGTVQDVKTEAATGDTLVQISLGSNDRIRTNSRLYLNRDGRTYLADLVIIDVDLNHSIGRVKNLQPGQTIRMGDQAWSRLSN